MQDIATGAPYQAPRQPCLFETLPETAPRRRKSAGRTEAGSGGFAPPKPPPRLARTTAVARIEAGSLPEAPAVKPPRRQRKKHAAGAGEGAEGGPEAMAPDASAVPPESPAPEPLAAAIPAFVPADAGIETTLPPRHPTRPEMSHFVGQLSDVNLAWLLQETARECRRRLLPDAEDSVAPHDDEAAEPAAPNEPHPVLLRAVRGAVADLTGEE